MRFIVALVVSFALVWACAKPLKKHPVPFYVCAVALVALYFWGVSAGVRGEAWSYFQPLMQRCALAFLLFTVVMFVGVLGEGNRCAPTSCPSAGSCPSSPASSPAGTSPSTAPPTCRAWRAPSPATWPSPGARGAHHRAHGGAVGHLGPAREARMKAAS